MTDSHVAIPVWNEFPDSDVLKDDMTVKTSYVNIVHTRPSNTSKSDTLQTKECVKQIFLSFKLSKVQQHAQIALLDTGSDLNLITESYLATTAPYWKKFTTVKTEINALDVNGGVINYVAIKRIKLHLQKGVKCTLQFLVIPDTEQPKCIIGRDIFNTLHASLKYNSVPVRSNDVTPCNDHFYSLQCMLPKICTINLLHLSIPGIFAVTSRKVVLKPDTITKIQFRLAINPFLTPNSLGLVTSTPELDDLSPDILFLDTRCKPIIRKTDGILFSMAVLNKSARLICLDKLIAHYEPLGPDNEFVCLTQQQHDDRQTNYPNQTRANYTAQPTIKSTNLFHVTCPINQGPNRKHSLKQSNKAHLCKKSFVSGKQTFKNLSQPVFSCNSIKLYNNKEQIPADHLYSADELLGEELMPALTVPQVVQPEIEDVIKVDNEPPEIQQILKQIFIEKYPSVAGRHNLDTGPVRYLGKIKLRTIQGMKLPKHTKIYSINEKDQSHLNDIVSFMSKYEIISETFQDDPDKPSAPWGAPGYLIMRKINPDAPNYGNPGFARLIIDYSLSLNKILEPTPALVKGIEPCLESLQGGFLFSLLDLKQSYYGLVLDPSSYALTQFIVPPGRSFVWRRMPMGISTAPASLLEKVNQILNFVPLRDESGNIVYQEGEDPNCEISKAVLVENKLTNIVNFYDDLLIFTPKSTKPESDKLEESMKEHFEKVEALIERMALYRLKITFHKCSWAKRYVDFLGWRVQDNKIIADENRINKVRNFDYPKTRKQLLGFLGLVNTLKRVSPLSVGEELAVLSNIASTKEKFTFKSEHKQAFDNIKIALTTAPLYCHMINLRSDKIIFSDASSVAYGSVLLSRIDHNSQETFSSHIDQNDPDPLNQMIRSEKLHLYIGEQYENTENSLFNSILFLIRYHNLGLELTDTLELRQAVIKYLRKSLTGTQIKEQHCRGSYRLFEEFLFSRIGNFKASYSPEDVVLYAIASFLGRGINVVCANYQYRTSPFIEILPDSATTNHPFNLGVYTDNPLSTEGRFVPLLQFKHWEFNPSLLNSKYEVNMYDSKLIPKEQRNKSILEKECAALLIALKKYKSYITGCQTYIVTDNRSLFYLFNPVVTQSYSKVSRYSLKLLADYPSIKILWCSSEQNLADLFTRFDLADEYETKIRFKACKVDELPSIPHGLALSWTDFENIARCHPKVVKLLVDFSTTYNTKDKKKLAAISEVYSHNQTSTAETSTCMHCLPGSQNTPNFPINPPNPPSDRYVRLITKSGVHYVSYLTQPIEILQSRLSKENIIVEQRHELSDLYQKLLHSDNLKLQLSKDVQYELVDFLIMKISVDQYQNKMYQIVVPQTLEMLVLALVHLVKGHLDTNKLEITVKQTYYFHEGKLQDKVRKFVQSCTACAINSIDSHKVPLQTFLINPDLKPFSMVAIDIAENLGKFMRKYQHLLVVKCLSTSFTLFFPLKSKKTEEVKYYLMYGFLQHYGPCKALYSDNALIFRERNFVALLQSLRIEVKTTVPLDSKSRGYIERSIRSTKTAIRKLLHSIHDRKSDNIEILPLLASLNMNTSYNTRVGSAPCSLIHGYNFNTNSLFDIESPLPRLHPVMKNAIPELSSLKQVIAYQNKEVSKFIEKAQQQSMAKLKHGIKKSLPAGTLVYIKSNLMAPQGKSRAFLPYYFPSTFVVLKEFQAHVTLMRLSDRLVTARSKNECKQFKEYERLTELPQEVRAILQQPFQKLSQDELNKLAQSDNFGTFKVSELPSELPPDFFDYDFEFDDPTKLQEQPVQQLESSDEEIDSDDDSPHYNLRSRKSVKFRN